VDTVVNSAENRVTFCKALDGRPLFGPLYGMYAVTLNELKAVLKVSARTSVESTAQDDDFQEVKRRRRHISNNTSQTSKKSTKPVPTSAAIKTPPKQC
jgi:hypothetical protein